MYSDIVQAKEVHKDFDNWRSEEDKKHGIPLVPLVYFNVDVLTSANWPHFHPVTPQIPYEVKQCIVAYEEFWTHKHLHKKLTWNYLAGIFHLTYHKGKSNDIVCNTLQGLALLLFNTAPSLTFKGVCEHLGIGLEEGRRVLQSLISPQALVEKAGGSEEWSETTEFRLNEGFSSAQRKVQIPLPEEAESTQKKKVETNRGIAIEAAIIKIMKARRTMVYGDLIVALSKVLCNFVPEAQMIKEKIDELITKEYLARDSNDPKLYIYVAN
eukprot:TRINITY_DN12694_c0_g3_i1.p1 TRINITY_DN12694_c0_g3~~TRINITY_DN12694_c0_g3_i1.p1  ORF type:complete len:268 (-),score=92.38 TRINITY_DN12694_c0_g3_i1:129-932(-)